MSECRGQKRLAILKATYDRHEFMVEENRETLRDSILETLHLFGSSSFNLGALCWSANWLANEDYSGYTHTRFLKALMSQDDKSYLGGIVYYVRWGFS